MKGAKSIDADPTQIENIHSLLSLGDPRLRQIVDLIPHMIFVKDAQGRFLMVNRAVASIYGLSPEQMVGKFHSELHANPHELARMLSDDKKVIDGVEPRICTEEVFHGTADHEHILQTTKIPFHMPGHTKPASLGLAIDVTEQRHIEQELRRTRDELGHRMRRSTMEMNRFWSMSPDLLCTATLDGQFKRVNPAWEKTLGYSEDELTSQPYVHFVHPDDRASTEVETSRLAEGDYRSVAFTNRYRCKDGSYRWLVWNAVVLPDQKTIYAVARDVTDRREAEDRFRTLVANIPGAVYRCACDKYWTMQYLSDAIETISGYPATDFIQNAVRCFVDIIVAEDATLVERTVLDAVEQHKPYDIEYRIRHHDGSVRWIHERGQGAFDDHGHVLWLDGVIFDMTEQKAAQQTLAQRTLELARSNADLEEFAYAASHDLRAPLRAIANLSQWIEEDAGEVLTGQPLNNLTLLRHRVNRMQQLIDDLLTYSRATRVSYDIERIELAKLLDDVVFMLNPPGEFTIAYPHNLPVVYSARAPLEQVLSNLIGNAVKHHDKSTGRVDIAVEQRGRMIEFTIADDGPGIDPAYHERVFKMFATLRSRDELEASGVGLALVKKLVERNGGIVCVESRQPRGCIFRFTWPAHGENLKSANPPTPPENP